MPRSVDGELQVRPLVQDTTRGNGAVFAAEEGKFLVYVGAGLEVRDELTIFVLV